MKINVIISDEFFIELSLKNLDEMEKELKEMRLLNICEEYTERIDRNLSRINKNRQKLYELRRSLQ